MDSFTKAHGGSTTKISASNGENHYRVAQRIKRSPSHHLVRLTLEGKRNRSLLAVNTHFPNQKDRPLNSSRAQRIVEVFNHIQELNRHRHLGLRLPRTMRVMDSDYGRAQLVQTHYPNEVALQTLPSRGDSPFYRNVVRQLGVLSRQGFDADLSAFIPVRTHRGDVQAILYHFALVQPKRERAPVQDIHRRERKKKTQ